MQNNILITTEKAAELLCCTKRKLEADRIRGGGVPFIKVGRCVRYDTRDIEAYVSSRKFHSTSEVI